MEAQETMVASGEQASLNGSKQLDGIIGDAQQQQQQQQQHNENKNKAPTQLELELEKPGPQMDDTTSGGQRAPLGPEVGGGGSSKLATRLAHFELPTVERDNSSTTTTTTTAAGHQMGPKTGPTKGGGRPGDENLDGGYAWLILLIMFLLQSSISGASRVYGLVYAKQVAVGYYDREQASTPIATASAVENLAGVLTPALASHLSWRQIELLSTLLFIGANLLAWASDSLLVDVLALGCVQGLALSTSTVLSLAINNDYFERYRTTAYGLSMSGSTFGVLYLTPIVSWLLREHEDFRCVYLMLAVVFSFNLLLVLFIKPRVASSDSRDSPKEQQQLDLHQDYDDYGQSAAATMTPASGRTFVGARLERQNSIASVSYRAKSRRQSVLSRMTSASCLSASREAAGEPDKFGSIKSHGSSSNRPASRHNQRRGPPRSQQQQQLDAAALAIAMGANPGDGQLVDHDGSQMDGDTDMHTTSSNDQLVLDMNMNMNMDKKFTKKCCPSKQQRVCKSISSELAADPAGSEHQANAVSKQQQQQQQQVSFAQQLEDEEEEEEGGHVQFTWIEVSRLLRLPYLHCAWIMLALYYLIARVFIIILVDFATDHGFTLAEATSLLNYWSLGELLGRVLLGSLIDLRWLSCRNCIASTCALLAASIGLMLATECYHVYAACSLLIAALISLEYMLINVLMVEYLGKASVTSCYSLAAFISSLVLFARPTLIGLFRDQLGSYDGLLLLLAAASFAYALLFRALEPWLVTRWPKRQRRLRPQ